MVRNRALRTWEHDRRRACLPRPNLLPLRGGAALLLPPPPAAAVARRLPLVAGVVRRPLLPAVAAILNSPAAILHLPRTLRRACLCPATFVLHLSCSRAQLALFICANSLSSCDRWRASCMPMKASHW